MNVKGENYGVVIACHRGDYRLAKGCIASIRRYCGEVPVCLLADGDFVTNDAEQWHGVQVMRRADVGDPWLRQNSFGGWGYSHLIPFWEGPFDEFLYLDADCVVLGDIVSRLRANGRGIVVPGTGRIIYDERIIGEHWYDCELVRTEFPEFDPIGRPFFCAGTFCGIRNTLDLDLYRRVFNLQKRSPGKSFHYGDQGLLNFLLFHAKDEGRAPLYTVDYQQFPSEMDKGARQTAIQILQAEASLLRAEHAMVLHYAQVKPTMFHAQDRAGGDGFLQRRFMPGRVWAEPMNAFRRDFAQPASTARWLMNYAKMWAEDSVILFGAARNSITNKLLRSK